MKFFFALSALEKYMDTLIMLRGDELAAALKTIMNLKEHDSLEGSFVSHGEVEEENKNGGAIENDAVDHKFVKDLCNRSKALVESTPTSVIEKLRNAEDEAINKALIVRQKIAEEKLQARLEAEAKAHKEAMEAERIRKEDEARAALIRARLVIYYKTHNPEKVDTVDKILEKYGDRTDLLDIKLKRKYGASFLPPVPHMTPIILSAKTNNFLSSMNHGLTIKKKQIKQSVEARRAKKNAVLELEDTSFSELQVALKVSPGEIMPTLCSTKVSRLGGVVRGDKDGRVVMRGRYAVVENTDIAHIKFYLIDSRPDESAKEQGRFPTSISLSPEAMMDPDKVQQQLDMFESLRGAVHICVMGEGFSKFPALYGLKLKDEEIAHAEDDEARTSMCALFFIKKGFPFVSILDGGFAAAHAWLSREGSEKGLTKAANLVDYDEELSLFGQLETSYKEQVEFENAPAREKAKKTAQKLLDNSMARLTMTEYRLESVASELTSTEGRQKVRQSVSTFFSSKSKGDSHAHGEEKKSEKNAEGHDRGNRFKIPFASKQHSRGENKGADDSGDKTETQGEGDGGTKTFDLSKISFHGETQPAKTFTFSKIHFGSSSTDGSSQISSLRINNPFSGDRNPFSGDKKQSETKDPKVIGSIDGHNSVGTNSITNSGISLKNRFANLSKITAITRETNDSEAKEDIKSDAKASFAKLGGQFKKNPFASIGSKESSDKKPTEMGNVSNEKGASMLRKNPFAGIGSKGSFEGKATCKKDASDDKSGEKSTETDDNASKERGVSILRKNPFANIGSKGSFDGKEAGKKDASNDKNGGKPEIGSVLRRNPFAGIGSKGSFDGKEAGRKEPNDEKSGAKAQNNFVNRFGVFGLDGKDLYESLSQPIQKIDSDNDIFAESVGKVSFQGISAKAASSILRPEGYSAQEESISFSNSHEETDDSLPSNKVTEEINSKKYVEDIIPDSSFGDGKDKSRVKISGGIENNASTDAEPPVLFPVFPVRSSLDPAADLFDLGELAEDGE